MCKLSCHNIAQSGFLMVHFCTELTVVFCQAEGADCGRCRKKLNLLPTGQVKNKAAQDGFDNVHDWLIFQATGESAAAIAAHKESAPWLTAQPRALTQQGNGKVKNALEGITTAGGEGHSRHSDGEAKSEQCVGKKRKRETKGSKVVATCVDDVHNAIARGAQLLTPSSAALHSGVVRHLYGLLVQCPQ